MSALLTPRRPRRAKRPAPRKPAGQSSLFAAAAAVPVAPPELEPTVPEHETVATAAPEALVAPAEAAPEALVAPAEAGPASAVPETFETASARRQGPTLDDLVAGAWEGLLAGATADCLVCGTPLAPRHSAGAGVVGGRCGGCGTTLS
jgi:hypothetical protein